MILQPPFSKIETQVGKCCGFFCSTITGIGKNCRIRTNVALFNKAGKAQDHSTGFTDDINDRSVSISDTLQSESLLWSTAYEDKHEVIMAVVIIKYKKVERRDTKTDYKAKVFKRYSIHNDEKQRKAANLYIQKIK